MQDTFYSEEKKVSAIIICNPADPLSNKKALAYWHVDNSESQGVKKFLSFARKFPTAQYVNFYSKTLKGANGKGIYLGRKYLTQ